MSAPAPFRRTRPGWALSVALLLSGLNSAFFFLGVLKAGFTDWIMVNSCALGIYAFFAGFAVGRPAAMAAASVWMLRYGFAGLFVFGWRGPNLAAQAGHLLMTAASFYCAAESVRHRRWRSLALGALAGAATLLPFMAVQNAWFAQRPGLLESLFAGHYAGPSP
jgi:hypothetical protein